MLRRKYKASENVSIIVACLVEAHNTSKARQSSHVM